MLQQRWATAPASAAPAIPARSAQSRTSDPPWDLLTVAVAVYLLAAVGRVHQLFPVLLPLKPLLLSSALALGLYFFFPTRRRELGTAAILRIAPMRWMAVLLGCALCSIPGALWVGGAFHTVVDILLKAVLMAVVLAGTLRCVGDAERLTGAYFGAVALYAAVVLSRFNVGGSDWRLNKLYYYDANDFATLAVTALPLGIYFALRARGLFWRLGAVLGTVMVTSVLIWTGSRGGFIALLCVGGFFLVGYSTIPLRWRITSTALVVVLFSATASDAYWEKMRSLLHPKEDYNLESQEGRKAIWLRGMGYMLAHPVLGVGAGNFPTAEGTISPNAARQSVGRGVKWQAAHNSYVQIGAELGIPGLLCFVGMIVSAMTALLRRSRRPPAPAASVDPRARPLGQALAAALFGFAVGAFFLSLAYTEALYVLVALSAGLWRVS